MLQQLKLWLHNVAYKNRRSVRAGNHLQLPASSAQRMKKVRIKLGGENNRLLIGQNVTLHNCEIRLDGRDNLIESLKKATLPEVVRSYETLVLGPGGTRALIQIQGSRFGEFGWARKAGAAQVAEPVEFHRLMGVQRYRGL